MSTITLGPYVSGEIPEPIEYTFLDADGEPIDITSYTASFVTSIDGAPGVDHVAEVSDGLAGQVTYEWQAGDLAAGLLLAEFVITNGTNQFFSDRLVANVRPAIPVEA